MLYCVLLILVVWPCDPAVAEVPPALARPDYATVTRALDGDPTAFESLISCAQNDHDCLIVAAAARHQQGRAEDAIELLRPLLARGNQHAMRIVAELAFEQQDCRLAWAAGSLWMIANDLEPPDEVVRGQGIRMPWLMGQCAAKLSDADLDQARQTAAKIRSGANGENQDAKNDAPLVGQAPKPEILNRSAPQLPHALIQDGIGGWAFLVLSINADGVVEETRELFASHDSVARSSAEAMAQWRFEPTGGRGIWTPQTIDISLHRQSSTTPEAGSGVPDEQGWIAFDNSRGWIEFTVRVNGVLARAMLDSGAQANAISRRLVDRAGIERNLADEVRVRGIHGEQETSTAGEFELKFGRATVPLRDAVVLPMRSPDLILGVGLFHASVVQIDYPNNRIRFLNRDIVEFESNVRVRTERGRSPQIRAELAGKKVWMLMDTGNAGAALFKRRLIRRLDLDQHLIDGADIESFGAVSRGRKSLLQLPGFKLGPFPFESLLASYIESGTDAGFEGRSAGFGSRLRSDDVPYDGILGSEVLKNFVITADVAERKIHLGLPQ